MGHGVGGARGGAGALATFLALVALAGCTGSGGGGDDADTGRGAAQGGGTARPSSDRGSSASPSGGSLAAADASCPAADDVPAGSLPRSLRAPGVPAHWFGSGGLWVNTPSGPSVVGSGAGAYRVKYASVTVDSRGGMADTAGPPEVAAERVDGAGRGRGSVGGYATATVGDGTVYRFWPTGIELPDAGCWLITESTPGHPEDTGHSGDPGNSGGAGDSEDTVRFLLKVP
ncbi:hypothetical protein [Streptomyces sp. NPDC050560]|uniref:hypothetical protein n=1 Tax=Streptomyces sp. NPDC050560 TaxID=3365630 RepID=UPI0037B27B7B